MLHEGYATLDRSHWICDHCFDDFVEMFGWKAVDKAVHVHDIHATILYLLGIDHTKLTYRYSGRDFRLTDVSGDVIHEIIA